MGAGTYTIPVRTVRTDGSVGFRMGERTPTRGVFVVADCPACAEHAAMTWHAHRRWRVQTVFGYLVGDLNLTSRQGAHAAAAALGALELDWTDPRLAIDHDDKARTPAHAVLSGWGLSRAVA